MIKVVKGDLIDLAKSKQFDMIGHGCNCFCTMQSGVAKAVVEAFPIAKAVDEGTIYGDDTKLGTYSVAYDEFYDLTILNLYTQYNYGKNTIDLFEYKHFETICKDINRVYKGKKLGLPKIGSGLAGGDWFRILKIIQDNLTDLDVTIVEL